MTSRVPKSFCLALSLLPFAFPAQAAQPSPQTTSVAIKVSVVVVPRNHGRVKWCDEDDRHEERRDEKEERKEEGSRPELSFRFKSNQETQWSVQLNARPDSPGKDTPPLSYRFIKEDASPAGPEIRVPAARTTVYTGGVKDKEQGTDLGLEISSERTKGKTAGGVQMQLALVDAY